MEIQDKGQSGYYQTIAREFLKRRGGGFFLSPRDQATIAGWEKRRIPLDVVLEGIARAFDRMRTRAVGTKGASLALCERQVEAAMAQHADRSAGGRGVPGPPRPAKKDLARLDVETWLKGAGPEDAEIARLLQAALDILAESRPDEAELERTDVAVEDVLWSRATDEDKRAAADALRKVARGGRTGGFEEAVRRKVVKTARDARKVPFVSLYYY